MHTILALLIVTAAPFVAGALLLYLLQPTHAPDYSQTPHEAPFHVASDSFGFAEVRDARGFLVAQLPAVDHATSCELAQALAEHLNKIATR